MAGGKKLPELDALTMAYRAVEEGAAGVDMGRNIFQSTDPAAMIRAVGAVVHESAKPQAAYDMFLRPPAEGTQPAAPEARNTEASRGHGR
jgi:putative autoinducer-2 (AI-2) aldolase